MDELMETIRQLRAELAETKEHLKRYTAPSRSKTYYMNHRDELLEKKKTAASKEQRIEINRRAYQKRKERALTKETNEKIDG